MVITITSDDYVRLDDDDDIDWFSKRLFAIFLKMSFDFFFMWEKGKANERRNVERTRLLIRFIDETGKNEIVLF